MLGTESGDHPVDRLGVVAPKLLGGRVQFTGGDADEPKQHLARIGATGISCQFDDGLGDDIAVVRGRDRCE